MIAIIGGGPAGLMAAEAARAAGAEVDVYDRLGSVGRKFLIAGKGGLNLTHSEAVRRVRRDATARAAREVARWLARIRRGRVARMGARARRRDVRRHIRPRLSDRSQGRAAAARVVASPARERRAFPHAPSLARMGRSRRAAFRGRRRRAQRARRRGRARARRRELAGARFGRRMGSDARERGCRDRAAGAVELRIRCRVERALRDATCRRSGEAGRRRMARRRGAAMRRQGEFVVTQTASKAA